MKTHVAAVFLLDNACAGVTYVSTYYPVIVHQHYYACAAAKERIDRSIVGQLGVDVDADCLQYRSVLVEVVFIVRIEPSFYRLR